MGSDSYMNNYADTNKHDFNFYYDDKMHTLGLYPKGVFANVYGNSYLLSSYDIFVADIPQLKFPPGKPPWKPGDNPNDPDSPVPPENLDIFFRGTMLFWSMLLPEYSKSLYPMLMPILKDGEVINNRPVYEIWMIWGFYKYLTSSYTTNESDDHEVLSFDLSPNWS